MVLDTAEMVVESALTRRGKVVMWAYFDTLLDDAMAAKWDGDEAM